MWGDSVQVQPEHQFSDLTGERYVVARTALRLLPGPHTAAEQAALDAAIEGPAPRGSSLGARLLFSSALVAVAITVPDISLGAKDSPLSKPDVGELQTIVAKQVWRPLATASTIDHVPAIAANEITPSSLTFSSESNPLAADRMVPFEYLTTGSERFDLAFAGMEAPAPVFFTNPSELPEAPAPDPIIRGATSAIRPQVANVQQREGVTDVLSAPAAQSRTPRSSLQSVNSGNQRVAAADQAVTTAFAGTLDVTREALPVSQTSQPSVPAPEPARDPVARAVPVPAPQPSLSASRQAQTELVPKTRLDARVNGVLTGSVDFQQLEGTIAIRLGSVVDMLRDRYTSPEMEAISGSGALNSYVTLAQLQAAGIPISYNPAYDEVEFGVDYDDAPQAAKVQVEQIGAPTLGQDRALIDQIPR